MRKIAILCLPLLALAACNNAAQIQATTTAVIDATTCVLTIAPPVVNTASQTGTTDTQKAIQSATVAYQAGAQSANCKAVATDVASAIAAGKVTAPTAATP